MDRPPSQHAGLSPSQPHSNVIRNPLNVVANASVDTGEAGLGASRAPGHYTDESARAINQWTTAVARTGVFATFRVAGTYHIGRDAVHRAILVGTN